MKHSIISPMSATVWQVVVEEQGRVGAGDEVVVLEAMKMEIPVASPVAGVVVSISVSPGASVEEGQVLVVIEEE